MFYEQSLISLRDCFFLSKNPESGIVKLLAHQAK